MLPQSIVNKASLEGGEYSWRVNDFLSVLEEAASGGFACTGGQFQFRFPDGTCEMYWLAADSTLRRNGESWTEYVVRSANEVRERFCRICKKADFAKEAKEWEFIKEKILKENVNPIDYLCFVAYFQDESGISY